MVHRGMSCEPSPAWMPGIQQRHTDPPHTALTPAEGTEDKVRVGREAATAQRVGVVGKGSLGEEVKELAVQTGRERNLRGPCLR